MTSSFPATDYAFMRPKLRLVTITGELRQSAKEAGTHAYHAGKIDRDDWLLYEKLLDFCGSKGFCWHKVETLAHLFQVCERELGRWLKKLRDAGLIRRERTNHSAQTYIATYVEPAPAQASFFGEAESDPDRTQCESDRINGRSRNVNFGGGEDLNEHTHQGAQGPKTPAARDTSPQKPIEVPETPAVRILRAAGTFIPECLVELADLTVEMAKYAVFRARRVRDPHDPGGLNVYFGRKLKSGELTLPKRGISSESYQGSDAYHYCPSCTHVIPIVGDVARCPHCDPVPDAAASPQNLEPRTSNLEPRTDDPWPQVQAVLASQVPPSEYTTWLAETQLLQLDDQAAIIGTSNIFARDTVRATYLSLIEDALEQVLGRRVVVEVVIGGAG